MIFCSAYGLNSVRGFEWTQQNMDRMYLNKSKGYCDSDHVPGTPITEGKDYLSELEFKDELIALADRHHRHGSILSCRSFNHALKGYTHSAYPTK